MGKRPAHLRTSYGEVPHNAQSPNHRLPGAPPYNLRKLCLTLTCPASCKIAEVPPASSPQLDVQVCWCLSPSKSGRCYPFIRGKRKGPAPRAPAPRTLDRVRLSSVAFVEPAPSSKLPPIRRGLFGVRVRRPRWGQLERWEVNRFRLGKRSLVNLSLSFVEVA